MSDFDSKIQNYIDGQLVDPTGNQWLDNPEPATGEVFAQVPDSDKHDLDLAVAAAKNAFPAWSQATAQERAKVLNRISDLADQNLEALALLESKDNGKPLMLAKNVDIPRV